MAVTQASVNSHKKAKHQAPTWRTCTYPECEYKYKMITQLKYHTARVHLGIKPHVCDECGKSEILKNMLAS